VKKRKKKKRERSGKKIPSEMQKKVELDVVVIKMVNGMYRPIEM
jgi:hypothetical protein